MENTWKLEDIYASREGHTEKDAAALKAQIAEFSGYQGKLGDGPQMLLAILKKRDAGGDHEPYDRLLKPALP